MNLVSHLRDVDAKIQQGLDDLNNCHASCESFLPSSSLLGVPFDDLPSLQDEATPLFDNYHDSKKLTEIRSR